MRVLSFFLGVMFLVVSAVSADSGAMIELRSIFLHGREYPGASHHLHLHLASDSDRMSADIQLSSFGEYVFAQPFMLPGRNRFRLSIQENDEMVLDIGIKIHGRNIETIPACRRLPDLHNIFPYKGFSSYVPHGTIVIGCDTRLGLIELQLRCHDGSVAATCGSD